MKLIFALGNPDNIYDGTRHNIGFAAVDNLATSYGTTWQKSSKFKALVAEFAADEGKIILAKPQTYYNVVGSSLASIRSYYAIAPEDTLIVHDDLALPFGTIRTRIGGSGGGNNGISSINSHGGEDTYRLRIGIWNELADRIDNADFVLSRFSKSESEVLSESIIPKVSQIMDDFLHGRHEITSYKT